MPVISRTKTHRFDEEYYGNQLRNKRLELHNRLQKKPNDLVAKEQFKSVNRVLEEIDKSKWPIFLKELQKNNFYWPDTREIKNGQ